MALFWDVLKSNESPFSNAAARVYKYTHCKIGDFSTRKHIITCDDQLHHGYVQTLPRWLDGGLLEDV